MTPAEIALGELSIGCVVIVKGHDVRMTFEGRWHDDLAALSCIWFVGGKLHRDYFDPVLLKKVSA